ncbi:RagB/SusD family nutrient uptake outer membrane protein [Galbibacter sp. EGI 63066]|uniref:RagB/SusD family nutrient uptake outer membrane protein n=1 Tax=Galbibacter sp. EGI 63066 TaxID=2993559 RepID=UPI002248BFF1|nr:RagB/SusD family nutrient uptake outer membrane protein [Galbibacter sp. EGI 63066]MCX2681972.1 RagB/SusD family nutrient uptake outer membrane protein [Galbibacter sp. EGI 63066]
MKKYIDRPFIFLLFLTVTLQSCDDYLDVDPKGVRLLETVEDYDLWMNNYYGFYPDEMNLLSDFADKLDVSDPPVDINSRVYTWQSQFNEDVTSASTPIWEDHYGFIYHVNAVIKDVENASGGTEEVKNKLKAEALLGRAFEYLHLVNLYGKVYNPSTANQDLAVPFMTGVDVTDEVPNRSTVQEIYNHIIEDLTEALPNLPEDNSDNRFRASKAAGYSVLARAYLYMGEYSIAADNAQMAIDYSLDPIINYEELMATSTEFPSLVQRSGTIYAKYGGTNIQFPTLEFYNSFEENDLRRQIYYTQPWDPNTPPARGEIIFVPFGVSIWNAYPNWGTSVSEMHLIIAEAAARDNDLVTANEQLHQLRKNRFTTENYVKFESSDQEEVLQKILTERTFEFAFNGLRWYDMKRLAAEGRMPEVTRLGAEGSTIATLPPDSDRYTLQIPVQVMSFNPDWEQNP